MLLQLDRLSISGQAKFFAGSVTDIVPEFTEIPKERGSEQYWDLIAWTQ
jgi:hypothetical protein